MSSVGSCCLVGVICDGTLYVANLGDSWTILGRLVKATGEVLALQLSAEHNAIIESVRQELHSMHPDDPQIVVLKHNVWCVKGLIHCMNSSHMISFSFLLLMVFGNILAIKRQLISSKIALTKNKEWTCLVWQEYMYSGKTISTLCSA